MTKFLPALALWLLASTSQAQTCQNLNMVTEIPPSSALKLLELRDGPEYGVDCEIGLNTLGLDGNGRRNVLPPAGYAEVYDHRIAEYQAPTEVARELGLVGAPDAQSLTAYRMVFERSTSSAARAPELDLVLESPPGQNKRVALLWRTFSYGQSADWQAQVSRIAELPHDSNHTAPCATDVATACLRTYWRSLGGAGASLDISLESGGKTITLLRYLNSNYGRTPRLKFGYVDAVNSQPALSGLKLRHRVCRYVQQGRDEVPADRTCRQAITLNLAAQANSLPPAGIQTYTVRGDNPRAYRPDWPLVMYVHLPDGGQYLGAQSSGWYCSSQQPALAVCTLTQINPHAPLPDLVVQVRTPAVARDIVAGFHLYPGNNLNTPLQHLFHTTRVEIKP